MNYRHDPLFAIDRIVKVPYEEIVPHHLGIPRHKLLQFLSDSILFFPKLNGVFLFLPIRLAPKEGTRRLFRSNWSSIFCVLFFLITLKQAICRVWSTFSEHVSLVQSLNFGQSWILFWVLFYDFSHKILLKRPSQIISVTEVEPIVDLNFVENVQIFGFFILVNLCGTPEQRYHFCLGDLINWVTSDWSHPLFACNEYNIEAFEKADKA